MYSLRSFRNLDPTRLVVAGLILFATCCSTAFAQSECEQHLGQAEDSYLAGQFEVISNLLTPCFKNRTPKAQKAAAYALVAKTHLANDDVGQATEAIRLLLQSTPEFTADFRDPVLFSRLVEEQKNQSAVVTVASVSKTDEPLREAPATVVVVTAEVIERRGYLDLEQVLYDLPGFDVSRGNGNVYSNFYQRGFRSNANERTLLLVDGVEQNHLMSNTAYLSRQYPLSNIDRVEAIYGPASTMYGANAYTGVISILSKAPEALIPDGKTFGFSGQATSGDFGTQSLDMTVAGRVGNLSWSLTGRAFHSEEPDLSNFSDWDYDPSFVDTFDYNRVFGVTGPSNTLDFTPNELIERGLVNCHSPPVLCRLILGAGGEVVAIELTEEGQRRAAEHDRALPASGSFEDPTEDWSVFGKLELGRFNLGIQAWQLQEGTAPWYTERARNGRQSSWSPGQLAIFANYSRSLGDRWSLAFSSRFKRHHLGSDSQSNSYELLANREGVNISNLIELTEPFGSSVFDLNDPKTSRTRLQESSSQFRNELTLVYQPSKKISVVSGLELRNSSIQQEFLATDLVPGPDFLIGGSNRGVLETGGKIEQVDIGLFSQASFRVARDLKAVVGARLDYNRLENITSARQGSLPVDVQGYGTVFNPRLALIYTPRDFVFKVIYAEAFKEPSVFERFDSSEDRSVNLSLEPEEVENLEISAQWQPSERLALEASAYEANYSTVVGSTVQVVDSGLVLFPTFFIRQERFNNLGPQRIRGAQVTASWSRNNLQIQGNYTYSDPRSLEPTDLSGEPIPGADEFRVADIAQHRLNLSADFQIRSFDFHLAANYVGSRQTGEGTTVLGNPFQEIDEYSTANAAVSYRNLVKGLALQLIVRNLLDEQYFHPGVQGADGVNLAARLPQPGRSIFLRLSYKM